MQPRVAVFARSPQLGHVKTRLAASIGNTPALQCYQEMLNIAVDAASHYCAEVWCEGDPFFLPNIPTARIKRQATGYLGVRMYDAFRDGVKVLIGSDIPLMSQIYIENALKSLHQNDLVLGPTEDGGYCLIGMNTAHSRLFEDIEWSTSRVLEQTLNRSEELHLRVHLLETLWDVDTAQDYKRWLKLRTV